MELLFWSSFELQGAKVSLRSRNLVLLRHIVFRLVNATVWGLLFGILFFVDYTLSGRVLFESGNANNPLVLGSDLQIQWRQIEPFFVSIQDCESVVAGERTLSQDALSIRLELKFQI